MSISFFDDLGGLFMHFGQLSLLRLLRLNIIWAFHFLLRGPFLHHQKPMKLNIIQKWAFHFLMTFLMVLGAFFFWCFGAFFTFWLTFVAQIAQPNHQKLNVIQKWEYMFWWLWGPFFAFWLTFVAKITQPINQKLKVIQKWAFDFWWLRGPFSHFGWPLSLRLLGWSSEVECNPKMRIYVLMAKGAFFFAFWLTFITQITQPINRSWT